MEASYRRLEIMTATDNMRRSSMHPFPIRFTSHSTLIYLQSFHRHEQLLVQHIQSLPQSRQSAHLLP